MIITMLRFLFFTRYNFLCNVNDIRFVGYCIDVIITYISYSRSINKVSDVNDSSSFGVSFSLAALINIL